MYVVRTIKGKKKDKKEQQSLWACLDLVLLNTFYFFFLASLITLNFTGDLLNSGSDCHLFPRVLCLWL